MTMDQLKSSLAAIMAAEEQAQIDWTTVDSLCDEVLRRLNCEPAPVYPHEVVYHFLDDPGRRRGNCEPEPVFPHDVVYHFLDDPDVRRKDASYAKIQRERLKEWLR